MIMAIQDIRNLALGKPVTGICFEDPALVQQTPFFVTEGKEYYMQESGTLTYDGGGVLIDLLDIFTVSEIAFEAYSVAPGVSIQVEATDNSDPDITVGIWTLIEVIPITTGYAPYSTTMNLPDDFRFVRLLINGAAGSEVYLKELRVTGYSDVIQYRNDADDEALPVAASVFGGSSYQLDLEEKPAYGEKTYKAHIHNLLPEDANSCTLEFLQDPSYVYDTDRELRDFEYPVIAIAPDVSGSPGSWTPLNDHRYINHVRRGNLIVSNFSWDDPGDPGRILNSDLDDNGALVSTNWSGDLPCYIVVNLGTSRTISHFGFDFITKTITQGKVVKDFYLEYATGIATDSAPPGTGGWTTARTVSYATRPLYVSSNTGLVTPVSITKFRIYITDVWTTTVPPNEGELPLRSVFAYGPNQSFSLTPPLALQSTPFWVRGLSPNTFGRDVKTIMRVTMDY